MHRKPHTWYRRLLIPVCLAISAIVLCVLVFAVPGHKPAGLADFQQETAHFPAQPVDRTWLPLDGLRRTTAAEEGHRARVHHKHHETVLRQRRRVVHRQAASSNTIAPSPSQGVYHGQATTQAEEAVAFAYAQIGCPYVYGGTGPCSAGFDCSGLTMEAWAAAGVSVPRTSESQWAGLPHVSQLQPGDIMIFNGSDGYAGHAAIYVGGGYLIDAPQTGESVEKVPFSGWYQASFLGAVRP